MIFLATEGPKNSDFWGMALEEKRSHAKFVGMYIICVLFFTVNDAYWNFLCTMKTKKAGVFYAACPVCRLQ